MRARMSSTYNAAQEVQNLVTDYVIDQGQWPQSLVDLGYQTESLDDPSGNYSIAIYENGVIGANVGTDTAGDVQYLVLEPVVENEQLSWICYGENLNNLHLPEDCRE